MGGMFAIAEFFRVKTLAMILSRKTPASLICVVRLPLDCSVKMRLFPNWTRKMPGSRTVFTALSWRAALTKLMKPVFPVLLSYPPEPTFLMTGSRGLRDGYYFQ